MTFHLVAWLIVQDHAGRVLLGRRSGSSYADGLWGLPGGHVEVGETLAQAAAREGLEEVGLRVNPAALTCLGACRYDLDGMGGLDVFFLTCDWAGEPTPLEKTSEVGWFDPHALPGDALPWLPGVLDAHLRGGVRLSEMLDGWAAVRGVPLAEH
ncbi:NUDIX domain-containing protein [Deinococcus soli (ex Cha et al. 2016)]|uniref:NUDIX hydrolase n=1 Tax=Deinococcus soli (ex Cha et al. 2016) TaxID=1309411 RepID=A0A0F7JTC4_9DEIO|nr:NUDIX domain-containing protein [Deinococcus soli (ex Cha et al. 2016)]AKH17930.1 NUDIX hydrolase [Deinococcus soli (ex Cha et al. 2016)]